jgi:hypothetical protein
MAQSSTPLITSSIQLLNLMTGQQKLTESMLDKNVLNELIRRLKEYRDKMRRGKIVGGKGRFRMTPDEVKQVTHVIDEAKQRIVDVINTTYKKEWPVYKQWEEYHGNKGHLLNMNAYAKQLWPHMIKIGSFNIPSESATSITIPQELYNILLWRRVIAALAKGTSNSAEITEPELLSLYRGLTFVAPLVKSNGPIPSPDFEGHAKRYDYIV